MSDYDLDRLDDVAGLTRADPQDMLRAVATSGAQVRASRTATREASLDVLGFQTRPRAIVVAGMGGSGISGDVLAAVAGMRCPVPIVVHRGYGLPGWVGAADLVIAVSCSGTTAETLTAAVEAARRGTSLLGVGSADSPLEEHCRNGGGGFVPIVKELSPRSSLWALTVPMLITASRYGLVDLGPDDADLEAAAMQLESAATLCSPDRESFTNPAKALAAELAGSLPLVWGTGQVGPVAAQRMVCQIAENAKLPAIAGGLPEAHHNQVVAFDGALAAGNGDDDLFRDRVEEEDPLRLRLLLLRDDDNDELAKKRAHASADVAAGRGIKVSVLGAQGESPLERIASLVGIADFASVYLGLAYGVNPTPIAPIDELKQVLQDPRTL
ncbi:MAG: mannose-6-phosphate isomerase [Frankiaceae bacterium]|nr:mannose-6-phosphate isomerase [Frankiaceae bacterium]